MELEKIQSSKRSRKDDDAPEADGKFAGGLVSWQNASSRIVRVSRFSGGKDRHSKVWTVKGLRDRRVRLSISTSIQFYDLQDRLGYDQPSKAVDWLINAAAAAILELPDLEAPFPIPPAVPGRAILSGRSPAADGGDPPAAAVVDFGSSDVRKQLRPLRLDSASEYLREAGNVGHGHGNLQLETSFSSLLHYGSNPHMGMGMMANNSTSSVEDQDIHQFSFMQDHAIPVSAVASGGDSNLNFPISSGIAGFTRETLQSNSPHLHHLVHGANLPFVLNGTIPIAAATAGILPANLFPGGFNGHLHLFGNEAYKHPELKGERNC